MAWSPSQPPSTLQEHVLSSEVDPTPLDARQELRQHDTLNAPPTPERAEKLHSSPMPQGKRGKYHKARILTTGTQRRIEPPGPKHRTPGPTAVSA